MKIERLFIYCLLAGTFLLASCSNENDVSDGDRLPDPNRHRTGNYGDNTHHGRRPLGQRRSCGGKDRG